MKALERILVSGMALVLLSAPHTQASAPMGAGLYPFGLLNNPWPQIRPFNSTIYNTGGAAFATTDNPWNPYYLAELEPYSHLRFMDWGKVNNTQVDHWTDRRLKHEVQTCTFKNDNVGVAYEWMADLCNRVNADMWVCIPHPIVDSSGVERGSNDYIRKLAILLRHGVDMGTTDLAPLEPLHTRDKAFFLANGGTETGPALNPDLRIFIEYSNESWNSSFVQAGHCQTNGAALGLSSNLSTAGFMFHAWAAIRVFDDFEDVFGVGSDRLFRVSAVQTTGGWQINKHLEVYRNSTYNPNGTFPDGFAGTFYVGGTTINGADTNLAAVLQDTMHSVIEPRWAEMRSTINQARTADGRDYLMVSYEGGQHLTLNADKPADDVMYDFYVNLLDAADNYYDLMTHYTHDGAPDDGGAWGSVKATTAAGFQYSQPTLEATIADNPKYRALLEYINETPHVTGPAAPSGLTAYVLSETQIALTWTDNATNETGYVVQRSAGGGAFATAGMIGADTTLWYDSGLSTGTQYVYRVAAFNSEGSSAWSATAAATPSAGSHGNSGVARISFDTADILAPSPYVPGDNSETFTIADDEGIPWLFAGTQNASAAGRSLIVGPDYHSGLTGYDGNALYPKDNSTEWRMSRQNGNAFSLLSITLGNHTYGARSGALLVGERSGGGTVTAAVDFGSGNTSMVLTNTALAAFTNLVALKMDYPDTVTDQRIGVDNIILEGSAPPLPPGPYDIWLETYPTLSDDKWADDDGDGICNFAEFALMGNPTNSSDLGRFSSFISEPWYEYRYAKRKDNSVIYTVQTSTNLTEGIGWTTNGVTEVAALDIDPDYVISINRVDMSTYPVRYIRLLLSE